MCLPKHNQHTNLRLLKMATMIIPENPPASYGEPIAESSGEANESGPELFRRILNDWAPALFRDFFLLTRVVFVL